MPVYIPMRNMMYYVETVEHSFSFGGQFSTTLHLAYGHKPWELLPEILAFSKNDEVYLTDGQVNVLSSKKTSKEQKQENTPKYTTPETVAGNSVVSPIPFQQAKIDTTAVFQSTNVSSGSLTRIF